MAEQEAPWRDMRRRRVLEDFEFTKSLIGSDFMSVENAVTTSVDTYQVNKTTRNIAGIKVKTGGSQTFLGTTTAANATREQELSLLGRDSIERGREQQRARPGRQQTMLSQPTTLNSLLGAR